MAIIFLKFLLAHLLADFIVQTPYLIERRKSSRFWLVPHVAAFAVLSVVFFSSNLTVAIVFAIGALSLAHFVLDYLKLGFDGEGIVTFLLDQAAHVLLIWAAATTLSGEAFLAALERLAMVFNTPKTLVVIVSLVLATATGSVLIGKITQPFFDRIGGESPDEKPGIKYAGTYIGMIERLLILLFSLTDNLSAIGFVFAAKSLIRFPESRDAHHFTEYFLIGTTSSFAYALVIGLAAKYLMGRYS